MPFRILIADAERSSRTRLRRLLELEPEVHLVGECSSAEQLSDAIRTHRPNLVFLTLELPGLGAREILWLLGQPKKPLLVLVTRHDARILSSITACGAEYLLQPFDHGRVQEVLQRARSRMTAPQPNRHGHRDSNLPQPDGNNFSHRLALNSSGKISFLNMGEIAWIRGAHNYAEFHTSSNVHLARKTITALEHQLPAGQFLRISRSLLVNLARIRELRRKSHGDYLVILQDGTELKGSRSYRDNLRKLPAFRIRRGGNRG